LAFVFGGTGVWTQGLTRARQALYYLSHASSLHKFCPISVLDNSSLKSDREMGLNVDSLSKVHWP
jgi:hypothetical protein